MLTLFRGQRKAIYRYDIYYCSLWAKPTTNNKQVLVFSSYTIIACYKYIGITDFNKIIF